jgi:hypothetical protein
MVLVGHKEVQCENVCNQRKILKMIGNLSELLDPKSLDGCPIDSETIKQAIKGREKRLTRKQSIP